MNIEGKSVQAAFAAALAWLSAALGVLIDENTLMEV